MFAAPIVKPLGEPAGGASKYSPLGRASSIGHEREIQPARTSAAQNGPRFPENRSAAAWDFSNVPIRHVGRMSGLPVAMQAKLKVGSSDDALEHEADRVADQVIRMAAPAVSVSAGRPLISRKGNVHAEEGCLPKQGDGPQPGISEADSGVHDVLRAPGEPLDARTRGFFEPRFGHDFSRVRVHTGRDAATITERLNARAMTAGTHILFGAGEYSPLAQAGRKLLAHELTHVVQQGFDGEADTLQRDTRKGEAPKQDAPKQDPLEAAILGIENNWKGLVAMATAFKELSPWITHGNAVVALLRIHNDEALAAIKANDPAATRAYKAFLQSDKVMYDFIAWHVTVYANLLSAREGMDRLVNAFDHDSDVGFGFHYFRKFKGRDQADRIARQIKKAIDGVPADSKSMLALVQTDVQVPDAPVPKGGGVLVVTSAVSRPLQATFTERIAAMKQVQINLQRAVEFENQFLDGAFDEAVDQTLDNLEEYYKIRSALKKGDPKRKEEKKQETKPEPLPVPLTEPSKDEKKKKKRRSTMRHQIQQGKHLHFASRSVTALDDNGVTGAQLRATMVANLGQYMDIAEGRTPTPPGWVKGPVRWEKPIRSGIIAQSQAISESVAKGGVIGDRNIEALQRCFDPQTLAPSGCREALDVRLDVENNGHNLKT